MKQQIILRKILAELKAEKPDLSYLRGLVEGLVEEEPVTTPAYQDIRTVQVPHITTTDEEIIPEFAKPGPLGRIS